MEFTTSAPKITPQTHSDTSEMSVISFPITSLGLRSRVLKVELGKDQLFSLYGDS